MKKGVYYRWQIIKMLVQKHQQDQVDRADLTDLQVAEIKEKRL